MYAFIQQTCIHMCVFKQLHICVQLVTIVAYIYATICKFLNSQYIPVINVFSVNPPPILAAAWNLPPATFHTSASFVFCPNFQALSLKKKKKKILKSINILGSPQKLKKKVASMYATFTNSCIHLCNYSNTHAYIYARLFEKLHTCMQFFYITAYMCAYMSKYMQT